MVTISLPFPPSSNNLFFNRRGGRTKTPEYNAWIAEADAMFMQQRAEKTVGTPIDGHFIATIALDQLKRRHNSDVDNRIKACLDFLQRVELIKNDSLCDKLDIAWGPVDGALIRAFKSIVA